MKSSLWFLISIFILGFTLLVITGCPKGENIEVEKEKIKYQEKIDATEDRADNLIALLETKGMEEAEESEQLPDSIQAQIAELKNIKQRLEQKSEEIEMVSEENWGDLKTEIDQIIVEFEKIVRKNEM